MSEKYLLKKNGMYHRPGGCGYTSHLHSAGIFTESEVEINKKHEPKSVIAISSLDDLDFKIECIEGDIEDAKTVLIALKEALDAR